MKKYLVVVGLLGTGCLLGFTWAASTYASSQKLIPKTILRVNSQLAFLKYKGRLDLLLSPKDSSIRLIEYCENITDSCVRYSPSMLKDHEGIQQAYLGKNRHLLEIHSDDFASKGSSHLKVSFQASDGTWRVLPVTLQFDKPNEYSLRLDHKADRAEFNEMSIDVGFSSNLSKTGLSRVFLRQGKALSAVYTPDELEIRQRPR